MSLLRPALPPHPTGPSFWPLIGWTFVSVGGWAVLITLGVVATLVTVTEVALPEPSVLAVVRLVLRMVIAAVIVAAVPAGLTTLALVFTRRWFGWSWKACRASALPAGAASAAVPAGLSLMLDGDARAAIIGAAIVLLGTYLAALLAWRFTLRRKGPAAADAKLAAEVFS